MLPYAEATLTMEGSPDVLGCTLTHVIDTTSMPNNNGEVELLGENNMIKFDFTFANNKYDKSALDCFDLCMRCFAIHQDFKGIQKGLVQIGRAHV